jgi:23S rRNA (uracil1939-C5)-methyltransferase
VDFAKILGAVYKKAEFCKMSPRKNTEHIIEITDVTEKGFGIGHIGDFVVFTESALPGDTVLALLVKVKKTYAYGKIKEIKKPSPFRVKSPCEVFLQCGGCQWQNCTYTAQLDFKKKIVQNALEKIGGQTNPPVFDVIGM